MEARERNLLQHNHVSRTLRVPLLFWKYIWRTRDEFEGFLGQRKRLITKYKTRRTGKIENPEKSSLKRPLGAEIFVFLFTNRRVLIVNKPILNEIQSVIEWLYYHSGYTFLFSMKCPSSPSVQFYGSGRLVRFHFSCDFLDTLASVDLPLLVSFFGHVI